MKPDGVEDLDMILAYAELIEIMNEENLAKGITMPEIDPSLLPTYSAAEAGWYQSASGDLYHYDGIIWDEVPARGLKLEFLGE